MIINENIELGPLLIAGIAAIPPTIAALLVWIKTSQVQRSITEVHLALDGRLDEFLRYTKLAAHAEGKLAEKSEQAGRDVNHAKGVLDEQAEQAGRTTAQAKGAREEKEEQARKTKV